jgi:hypothetical protein
MSPFTGHPEGCSPATLALLDRVMMEAWREMVFKSAAAARRPQGPAQRSSPPSSSASSIDHRPKDGPTRK